MILRFLPKFLTAVALGVITTFTHAESTSRPNVILIITDDQGYGEIAAHGNPVIKTPSLDQLHSESMRLTDFHVDPTCSPSRSALLTGRHSTRTGVWHTINGRSMMRPDELTLAEIFKANGYTTAMIGKWHLGDNHPCRPQDQGFEHVIQHLGGGIGNGPWAVDVKQAGIYEITLHRWPPYLDKPMEMTAARLTIGGIDQSQPVEKTATSASFRVKLEAGSTMLQTWLNRPDRKQHGAYFTSVRYVKE